MRQITLRSGGLLLSMLSACLAVPAAPAQSTKPDQTLPVRTGGVFSLAFSPNGKTLAVGGSLSNTIELWDLSNNKLQTTLSSGGWAYGLAFSPDGKILYAAMWHGRIGKKSSFRAWNVVTGKALHVLEFEKGSSRALALSKNGSTIAVNVDGTIVVLDAATFKEKAKLTTSAKQVCSLAFHPLGNKLAAGSYNGPVFVFDLIAGGKPKEVPGQGQDVRVAFSPDGALLACSARAGNAIALLDSASLQVKGTLEGGGVVHWLAFAPDGKTLAAVARGRTLRIWNLETYRERTCIRAGFEERVGSSLLSLAYSPNGKILATGLNYHRDSNIRVRLWDPSTGRETDSLRGHKLPPTLLALSPDSKRLASAANPVPGSPRAVELKLWDATTREATANLSNHKAPIKALAFDSESKVLASGSADGMIYLWDARTGEDKDKLSADKEIATIAFSPQGRLFAWSTIKGGFTVRDLTTKKDVARFTLASSEGTFTFSRDGKSLLLVSGDDLVVYDIAAQKRRVLLAGKGSKASSPSYSRSGLLAWVSAGKLTLCDPSTGKTEVLSAPTATRNFAFSPDGKLLAGTQEPDRGKGRIIVWDVATGKPIAALQGHESGEPNGGIIAIVFTPDGKTLITSGHDRMIRFWKAPVIPSKP